MEVPTTSKGIIKKKSTNYDIEASENEPMQQDFEGQRYLEYKSITGMDLVPRIRQPTPEKSEAVESQDPDCQGCQKYKQKFEEVARENKMLREELEKV